jgi:hypothetical protein
MYNIIQNITGNYYYSLILLSFIFYIISKYNTSILLSIIIIFSIYIYIDINIKKNISNKNSEDIIKEESLVNEIKDVKEVDTDNFYINKSNKKVKFLIKNKEFVNIIYNVRFIKKYDNSRYTKMIIFMNKLMKIYIYILSDRYDLNTYLPIFTDTKDDIIEIFYSLVFVVPEKFKHTYGFVPQIEIDKSLGDFRIKIKYMLNVLINYGNVNKNNVYINIDKYKPFEKNKENYLP